MNFNTPLWQFLMNEALPVGCSLLWISYIFLALEWVFWKRQSIRRHLRRQEEQETRAAHTEPATAQAREAKQ